ncbi:50S ribosomal protein L15 [Colletotrichum tanaceti]|uniref:50S ribosomal protein L15 n=1 Tax=Colletotrichum tanaceti TaxID=1306861 RepID=A0A4U6X669_9PEZI|nr:50S ribosomal protein L15 [Colletotrichum tanaceti]
MPPRLLSPLHLTTCCSRALRPSTNPPSLVSLFAGLSIGTTTSTTSITTPRRNASILASLSDNKGAYNKRIRVGRGASAGKGKTSGRGHKGQGQHGKVKPWFQGGQTPLIVQRGSKGFSNLRAPRMSKLNLDKLQQWIDAGRIDPTKQITVKEIIESGLIGTVKDGIKLLGRGKQDLRQPIDIMVSRASASAIDAVEANGGKILTRFYTKQSIRRILRGESENTDKPLPVGREHVNTVLAKVHSKPFKYRLPDATSREDIEYYRDPAHRGYLSHLLKEGESPSLYFKVPIPGKRVVKFGRAALQKAKKASADDILW